MIFIHNHLPGIAPGAEIPMEYIKEFLIGPDVHCWHAALRYYALRRDNEELGEGMRAIAITAHAHARYHFNIPLSLIGDMTTSSTIEIINRLDELLGYHPVRAFAEIEKILVHHEPFMKCYEPKSDAEEMQDAMTRYDPDS